MAFNPGSYIESLQDNLRKNDTQAKGQNSYPNDFWNRYGTDIVLKLQKWFEFASRFKWATSKKPITSLLAISWKTWVENSVTWQGLWVILTIMFYAFTLHCAQELMYTILIYPWNHLMSVMIIPIVRLWKLRLRKVGILANVSQLVRAEPGFTGTQSVESGSLYA